MSTYVCSRSCSCHADPYSSPVSTSVNHQYHLCYVSAHKLYSQIKTVLHILHCTTTNEQTDHTLGLPILLQKTFSEHLCRQLQCNSTHCTLWLRKQFLFTVGSEQWFIQSSTLSLTAAAGEHMIL